MLQLEKSIKEKCEPCKKYQEPLRKALRISRWRARRGMPDYLDILQGMLAENERMEPDLVRTMRDFCDACGGYSIYNKEQLKKFYSEAIDVAQRRNETLYDKARKIFHYFRV